MQKVCILFCYRRKPLIHSQSKLMTVPRHLHSNYEPSINIVAFECAAVYPLAWTSIQPSQSYYTTLLQTTPAPKFIKHPRCAAPCDLHTSFWEGKLTKSGRHFNVHRFKAMCSLKLQGWFSAKSYRPEKSFCHRAWIFGSILCCGYAGRPCRRHIAVWRTIRWLEFHLPLPFGGCRSLPLVC